MATRVSAEDAIDARRRVNARAAAQTLKLTLAAVAACSRGERPEVTLGVAESTALLAHLDELRDPVGAEKRRAFAAPAVDAALVAELRTVVERGAELLRRLG